MRPNFEIQLMFGDDIAGKIRPNLFQILALVVIYDFLCRRCRTACPTGRTWAAASRRPAASLLGAPPPGPVKAVKDEPATGSGRLRFCCGPLRDPRRLSPRPPRTLAKRNASSKGPIAFFYHSDSLFFTVQARFWGGDVKNNKSVRAELTSGGVKCLGGDVSMAKIMSKRTPGRACGR